MKQQQATGEPAFSKAQILEAKKYRSRRDLLAELLTEELEYTLPQVDAVLEQFMKGKVR